MYEIRWSKNISKFLTDIPILNCCQQLLPKASESWPNFNLGAFSSLLLLLLRLSSPLLLLLLGSLVLQAAADAADRAHQGGEDSASNQYAAKPGDILSNFMIQGFCDPGGGH